MEREIYATDGVITLCSVVAEDKENYLKLRDQVSELSQEFRTNDEIVWRVVYELQSGNYSVIDSDGEYCGNASFHNPGAKTPEIGIELLEHKRNMGIGPRAVKLLAQTYYADNPVEYFVLRVRRKNTHSRHMIEKLGCIYEKVEDDTTDEMIARIEKNLGKPLSAEFKEAYLNKREDGEDIMMYKYFPEAFLDKQ